MFKAPEKQKTVGPGGWGSAVAQPRSPNFLSGTFHFCHPHFFTTSYTVVFIQIYQFCALYWAKIAFFCLPKVFYDPQICQKCVSTRGSALAPLGELTTLPRLRSRLGKLGEGTPFPRPHLFCMRHSIMALHRYTLLWTAVILLPVCTKLYPN